MRKKKRKYHIFTKGRLAIIFLLFSILALITSIYYISPEKIVESMGIDNAYIFLFVISVLGSVSSFTSYYYYVAVVTLSAGGLNLFWMALIGGVGITIGDMIFYYVGYKSKHLMHGSDFYDKIQRYSEWLNSKPPVLVYLFVFIYVGLLPLPSDFLMVLFALGSYSFLRLLPVIVLANITQIFLLGFISTLI